MGIIAWIVLGLIVGVIAKTLLGGRAKHGIIVTILIGIAGALLGGWVASEYFGVATEGFFDASTWITAILGSVALLLVYHVITSRSGSRGPARWFARR
ncbi:putative membrane protein YeaQ/YmgE (transglycosylase-associated protein family) [Herbihabitans rhizosphaerae]|uniref:Putative membrane protein YeaQ/YmgE (Transglycosylase-associated protein family) n=1 Tax=Herbihabitans rhizosphaerae TaxID=1872711 RepID=A0A4Q7KCM6_9PSEU|nr:GlsB/YeaQ/YmgE family stress response membrane protein [Herbihabitans rhizosphaerae]RZS29658.1 putative membrane protein YeaQ/YmgE (transglycosylase-associated protein family) [Herbihabitans rhizosphaerae]